MRLFGGGTERQDPAPPAERFPYRLRDDFLTPAERSFYGVLAFAVGSRAVVCPKVNLKDVFFVSRPNDNRAAANRIAQKHVDFLLCKPDTMKPVLGVELDDSTHARSDRKLRDDLVDRVFEAGELPLLRIPAKSSYDSWELLAEIGRYADLDADPEGVTENSAGEASPYEATAGQNLSAPPVCPKCGEQMVVRVASRGENRGQRFFGCPNYPRCRHTAELD